MLGRELKRLREVRDLSQQAVADAVKVKRTTVTQWESDRYPPSAAKIRRLDQLLDADGTLIELAGLDRVGNEPRSEERLDGPVGSLAQVFDRVADRLVHGLLRLPGDPGEPDRTGWAQSLGPDGHPTPWSTALGIRTLLLLDRAEVDVEAIVATLGRRHIAGGWSNRGMEVPRPEVTATVVAVLHRLGGGGGANLSAAWDWLSTAINADERGRPFVLSTILEYLAPLRPDDPFVAELVDLLLAARTEFRAVNAWAASGVYGPERVRPSALHTARAVVALRAAPAHADRPDVADAVAEAVAWLAGARTYDGVSDTLRIDRHDRALDVQLDHFTSAHVVRAFVASGQSVPAHAMDTALAALWNSYSPAEGLWAWMHDGRLPVWMNHDAVLALRLAALAGYPTPVRPDRGPSPLHQPHTGDRVVHSRGGSSQPPSDSSSSPVTADSSPPGR